MDKENHIVYADTGWWVCMNPDMLGTDFLRVQTVEGRMGCPECSSLVTVFNERDGWGRGSGWQAGLHNADAWAREEAIRKIFTTKQALAIAVCGGAIFWLIMYFILLTFLEIFG